MQFLEGISVAASLEFRQRIRAGRWKWILGGWFVLNFIITALMFLAFSNTDSSGMQSGPAVFGYLMFFALGLLLLVCPSLTAQSVNGDRERGTLATLQVTRLSATEIALGKLFAAWLTAVVFIVLLIPLVIWCMAAGGLPFKNVISVFTVLTLLVGVICAISLALSSLFKRSSTSTVMSYLAMFALTVITVVVFLLVGAFFTTTRTIQVPNYYYSDVTGQSAVGSTSPQRFTEPRRDLIWWILAPNPVVVMADATPAYPRTDCSKVGVEDQYNCQQNNQDALRALGDSVRSLRLSPFAQYGYGDTVTRPGQGGAVWPYGLAFDLLLAVGAVVLTSRRLRTPSRKLPRGQRVA